MSKTQERDKNLGGRPRVDSTPITLRVHPRSLAALDNWRREQPDIPTRPEAVRRIIDETLRAKGLLN